MDILKTAESLMSMDEKSWQKHSSPVSVYSRFTIIPLFTVTLALREVLGWWTLVVLLLVSFWTWLNPRIFQAPKKTNNWASMGTFGERIYLNRYKEDLIPLHHLQMCRIIMVLQMIGIPFWIFSFYTTSYELMFLSMLWLMFTKTWFVDRMVWVYQDVKNLNSVYHSWLRT
ncbi:hypothetical protein O4H50_12275 [Vibrio diazotrophicus]|uniref:DUF6653 family protein n=1 Tax=Vibrio diazotrophicus TaxID=685 RepID=UPI0022AE8353|nr:DUF6653 family protein [Vibrio diazotrophicus]MCZ4372573.1 hypothetical protein [Vibrio diazotrophicus]